MGIERSPLKIEQKNSQEVSINLSLTLFVYLSLGHRRMFVLLRVWIFYHHLVV